MITLYPYEITTFFKQYPTKEPVIQVKSKKLGKINKIHKNRDNTAKLLNEKASQLLEKYLNMVPSDDVILTDDIKNISDIDISSALIRWGMIGKKLPTKYKNKDRRLNARKYARKRKSVLQGYDFENKKEPKEENLQQLVAELEQEEFKKTEVSSKSLIAWVILMKSFEKHKQDVEARLYRTTMQDLADRYFESGKIVDVAFADKINSEKNDLQDDSELDLQDVYELSHNNMHLVINMINQRNK